MPVLGRQHTAGNSSGRDSGQCYGPKTDFSRANVKWYGNKNGHPTLVNRSQNKSDVFFKHFLNLKCATKSRPTKAEAKLGTFSTNPPPKKSTFSLQTNSIPTKATRQNLTCHYCPVDRVCRVPSGSDGLCMSVCSRRECEVLWIAQIMVMG